jgi:glycolate oxidase
MEKREFLPRMFNEVDVEAMRRVRRAIDPKEIANRGKMFPGAEAPSLTLHGLHPLERSGTLSRE